MKLERVALTRGIIVGLVFIVPVAALTTFLKDTFDFDSSWLILPFLLILAAYVFAGFGAGTFAPTAPLVNGSVAALASFLGYLAVRIVVPAITGHDVDLTAKGVFINTLLAVAFGMFGGALATRTPERT